MLHNGPKETINSHNSQLKNGSNDTIAIASHQLPIPRPSQGTGERCSVAPRQSWYLPVKRCADLLAAAVLLVFLGPFIVLGVILVKLTSRGPAFYSQVRVGKDGSEFTLYKLRTMRDNAEAETGPVWSTTRDSRVTPIGKLLRSSHIDEFPQLWNVLRGQMSLVGPRPESPEFVSKLEWEVAHYGQRLKVRPGITGLAQLRLEADMTLDCVRRKVEHDVYYVKNLNPWLDLKIMLFTAWRLVREVIRYGWKCVMLPTNDEIGDGFQHAVGLDEFDRGIAHFPVRDVLRSDVEIESDMVGILGGAE